MNISQLPPSVREGIMKLLISQNTTLGTDSGIFSREDICNDTRNSDEPMAVDVSGILCGSHVQCPGKLHLIWPIHSTTPSYKMPNMACTFCSAKQVSLGSTLHSSCFLFHPSGSENLEMPTFTSLQLSPHRRVH